MLGDSININDFDWDPVILKKKNPKISKHFHFWFNLHRSPNGPCLKQERYFFQKKQNHGCSNHSNLKMEPECLIKNMSYLNLNILRTKDGRNKL